MIDLRRVARQAAPALAALVACCAGPGAETRSTSDTQAATTRHASVAEVRLDSAARRVVAFLRGQLPPDSVPMSDTVVLRIAPDGGGHEARVARATLRSPLAWVVPAGRTRFVIAPPATYTKVTTAVGRHLDCREYDLAMRAPDWASMPHVGLSLSADVPASTCLRTWNATFVFDTTRAGERPRLAGVLYDQWEW